MKITGITVALLLTVASVDVYAQAGGNTPSRQPGSTANGMSNSKQGSQSPSSGHKNTSSMGAGAAHSKSGSGSQATGTMSRQGSKGKEVNQQAAGVPISSGSNNRRSSPKPTKKQ